MNLPFGYTFEAEFHGALPLFVIGFLLMIIFIILMNKRAAVAKGQLEGWRHSLILFLRILSVLLLLLLIVNPDINMSRIRSLPKRVAVVIDQSSSMTSAWDEDEEALLASISEIISNLRSRYEVDLYSMDGTKLSGNSIEFTQDISAFDWSPPRTIVDDHNIHKAAIIISDGHLNRGRSPLDLAWSKSLPLFPLLPLKPLTSTLLKISELQYATSDKELGTTLVNIKIQQEGLVGQLASIAIYDETKQPLAEQTFRINSVFSDAVLTIQLEGERTHSLTVTLSLIDGDLLSESPLNITHGMKKEKVLLLSGHLNELHKQLILNLPDSLYEISAILGTSRKPMELQFQTLKNINPDLIILNEPGSKVYSDVLEKLVRPKGGQPRPVILFHSGKKILDLRWEKLIGVKQFPVENPGERTVFWDDASYDHPLRIGLIGQGFSAENMISFPPVFTHNYELRSSGFPVLTSGSRDEYKQALTITDNPPLAVFNGENYWKWFFHPQASTSFVIFWEYLLEYLDGIAEFKPVNLQLPVDYGATGDYIVADILIKDVNHTPIPSAAINVWQEDDKGNPLALKMTPVHPGTYTVEINTKQVGEYRVIAEVFRFGELWGRDTSRIKLLAYSEENQSRGVDEVFLQRLAKLSDGGKVIVDTQKLPMLPEASYSQTSSFQLRGLRSNGFFLVLLGCLIFEWLLRRRSGLL